MNLDQKPCSLTTERHNTISQGAKAEGFDDLQSKSSSQTQTAGITTRVSHRKVKSTEEPQRREFSPSLDLQTVIQIAKSRSTISRAHLQRLSRSDPVIAGLLEENRSVLDEAEGGDCFQDQLDDAVSNEEQISKLNRKMRDQVKKRVRKEAKIEKKKKHQADLRNYELLKTKILSASMHEMINKARIDGLNNPLSTQHYESSMQKLDEVLYALRDIPQDLPAAYAAALRAKAHIEISRSNYPEAIRHLEVMRNVSQHFLPDDTFFLTCLYLGIHPLTIDAPGYSQLTPCLNLEKAYEVIMTGLPEKLELDDNWNEFLSKNPESSDMVNTLVLMRCKKAQSDLPAPEGSQTRASNSTDIRKQYICTLPCISAYHYIKYGNFRKAMTSVHDIGMESAYLKDLLIAEIKKKNGNITAALKLYNKLLQKDIPVFHELSDLLIKIGALEEAVTTLFAAARYYEKHHNQQAAAYFELQAECQYTALVELRVRESKKAKEKKEADRLRPEEAGQSEMPSMEHVEEVVLQSNPSPTEINDGVTVKEPSAEPKPVLSPNTYYFKLQRMMEQFNSGGAASPPISDIEQLCNEALKNHPYDLWLLHSIGWWHHTQEQPTQAKVRLLEGLQLAFGHEKPTWKVPSSSQTEKKLLNIIINACLKTFESNKDQMDELDYKHQSRDIAAFFSAYAHTLSQDGMYEYRSKLRNIADRLDDRRRAKSKAQMCNMIEGKIRVLSQREFDERVSTSKIPA